MSLKNLKVSNRLLVDFGQVLELDEIDAAFAGFTFGNERLVSAQQFRYLDLGELGVNPSLPQETQELLVMPLMNSGLQ